ncbi:hypothetical protein [Cellulomonas marina]|uniref:Uncharacterized protein n=1 Tax=Cellulomonas marina TaxID=988821 RepID=A0A1I0Y3D0_9CELL|nr:hypothetical protein [Cellulomonas marina]GIG29774.1 hypothetical protein Cma02nite_23740 [Cellulomonas marina]SFB07859.1 hypothetical protein SAMN05421867_106157 [Cellulomonas marina]
MTTDPHTQDGTIPSATAGGTGNPHPDSPRETHTDPEADPRLPDPSDEPANAMEELESPFSTAKPGDIGRS